MYLLSQLWLLLLTAFVLGMLVGYYLWRFCVENSWFQRYRYAEAGVRQQLVTVEARSKSLDADGGTFKTRAVVLEKELETTRAKLAADVSAVEAREKNVASEVTRLEGELATLRRASEDTARKHAEALKAAEMSASTKVQTLVSDTSRKHDADVAAAKAAAEAAAKRQLDDLVAKHAAELKAAQTKAAEDAARKQAEAVKAAEDAAAAKAAAAMSDGATSAKAAAEATGKRQLEEATAKHAAELKAAQARLDEEKKKFEAELAAARKAADELRAAQASAAAEAARKHAEAVKAAEASAATKIQTLVSDTSGKRDADIAAAKAEAEATAKRRIDELAQKHVAELRAAEAKIADERRRYEADLTAAKRAADDAARKAAEALKTSGATVVTAAMGADAAGTAVVTAKPAAAAAAAPAASAASASSHDAERPVLLYAPRGKADDLKLIYGVAEGLEKRLNGLGIFHFDQIAGWTDRDIAWFKRHLGDFADRPTHDKWAEQCKKLATGWRPGKGSGQKPEGYGEGSAPAVLKSARNGKGDDLKLIWGVGEKLEEQLHRLGIFHFEQVAAWSRDNIVWVENQIGEYEHRIDRDDWIGQAKKLATGWRPSHQAGDKPSRK